MKVVQTCHCEEPKATKQSLKAGLLRPLCGLAMTATILLTIPVDIFAVEANAPSEWVTLETGYLTVYYLPGADLRSIEAALRQRATYFSSEIPSENAPVEEKIRYQLDALFRRAETVLDMRPGNIHIKIKILRSRSDVNGEYARVVRASDAEASGEEIKSFYVDKYNTIYISEEDMSDSIIAHEMGHAIVDHYFGVIPPEKVRELLASYVDAHLAE